jgi:RNA polymerase sigma-70 factor (ECF subfamily)
MSAMTAARRQRAFLAGRSGPDGLDSDILLARFPTPRLVRGPSSAFVRPLMPPHLDELRDEELIASARETPEAADRYLALLYRRWYPKVAAWCLRLSGNREEAADLAQEVFLRVHERLASFRGESRFSTWLYTVTRSVVINRGQAARRRQTDPLDEMDSAAEPVEPSAGADRELLEGEIHAALRQAMARDLDPIEARVLYLHYVDGMTLPALTDLLQLDNKSGAKAYVVSGGRKLKRRFGRWLARQSSGGSRP